MTTKEVKNAEHVNRMKDALFQDIGEPLKDPFFQLCSTPGGSNEYIRSGQFIREDAARKQLLLQRQQRQQPQLSSRSHSRHNYPCDPIPIPKRKGTKTLPTAYHKTITSSPGINPPGKPMNAPSELAIRMINEDPLQLSPRKDLGSELARRRAWETRRR